MGAYIAPGVYTQELDFSLYAPQLATSIFGVVITATKGPIGQAIRITNYNQLVNTFGTPDANHVGLYACQQFLRRGSQLLVVRAAHSTADYASVAVTDIENSPQTVFTAKALTKGTYANGPAPAGLALVTSNTDGYGYTQITGEVVGSGNGNNKQFSHSIASLPASKRTIVIRVAGLVMGTDDGNGHLVGTGILTGTVDYQHGSLSVTFVNAPGSGSNNILMDYGQIKLFNLAVVMNGVAVETFKNLSIDSSSANYFLPQVNGVASTLPGQSQGPSRYITLVDGPGTALPSPASWSLAGGVSGDSDITDADYIGTTIGQTTTGLQLFANAETLDVNLIAVPGVSSDGVVEAEIDLASTRLDCMALIDPPFGLSVQQVVDWHNGAGAYSSHSAFNSSYAALYWPWIQIFDSMFGVNVWAPPSGFVAEAFAFTDSINSMLAPAGMNRGVVLNANALEYAPNLGDREFLNGDGSGNCVNTFVNFARQGIVIWSQKTLQRQATGLDRISARRMVLYAEKVIATSSRTLVFDPNDSTMWTDWTNLITPVLTQIAANRGISRDASGKPEFAVVMNATTTSQADLANNLARGFVFLKSQPTGEKIVIAFVLTPQGATFSDATSIPTGL